MVLKRARIATEADKRLVTHSLQATSPLVLLYLSGGRCLKLRQQIGKFERSHSGICALVSGLGAGALDGLLDVFGGQDAKGGRHAGLQVDLRHPLEMCIRDSCWACSSARLTTRMPMVRNTAETIAAVSTNPSCKVNRNRSASITVTISMLPKASS